MNTPVELKIALDKTHMKHLAGLCFTIPVENLERYDEVFIFEGGKKLGPLDSIHTHIVEFGSGLYSPWEGNIFFSSGDGSDPSTNDHAYRIEARIITEEEKRRQKPKTIHLNLTEKCNLLCRICKPEDFSSYEGCASLSRDVIDKVIAEAFDTLSHLRLDSAGELLLSPHLSYVLEEATKRNIPIFVSSNGALITEEKAEMLCSSSLDCIQISVDSPERETLEWIRRGADYDKVIQGAKNLVKARERRGSKKPRIEFHAALMRQNIKQLPDLMRLARNIGIDGVGVAYCFIHQYMDPEWAVFWEKETCNTIIREAAAVARELGISFNAPLAFNAPRTIDTTRYCQYLFDWSYIQPTGKVYPCCISSGEYECGDLNTELFTDVWFGKKYNELRDTYNSPNPVYYKCASCYISAGWHPNDYKSHFNQAHWKYIEERLKCTPEEQQSAYCTYGDYLLPADLADDIKETALLNHTGRAEVASAILLNALTKHPEIPDLHNIYAETLVQSGHTTQARQVIERILHQWPENWQALNNLAVLETYDHKYRNALELFKKVLEINPGNKNARKNLLALKEQITAASNLLL